MAEKRTFLFGVDTSDTHALVPFASNARSIIVVLPLGSAMPFAIHAPVPQAVPVAPLEVCHVTWVIPAPPVALPLTEILDAVVLTTESTGATIEIATGEAVPPIV